MRKNAPAGAHIVAEPGRVYAFMETYREGGIRRRRLLLGSPYHRRGVWHFRANTYAYPESSMPHARARARGRGQGHINAQTAAEAHGRTRTLDIQAWEPSATDSVANYEMRGLVTGLVSRQLL